MIPHYLPESPMKSLAMIGFSKTALMNASHYAGSYQELLVGHSDPEGDVRCSKSYSKSCRIFHRFSRISSDVRKSQGVLENP